ncbi:hypothetical protein C2E23DRAFT_884084 [Lenzites betulinus]|nr:hypothetical protein C2E23DRAFT_884084 [Lenzites betulinus]
MPLLLPRRSASEGTLPDRAWDWDAQADIGEGEAPDTNINTTTYRAWRLAADLLHDLRSGLVKAWADQADGLITFATLFSAIVTAFIIESYKNLKPDTQLLTFELLRNILTQADEAASVVYDQSDFTPAPTDIILNSLLFASLLCSILAAAIGILYKEWLREYAYNTPVDPRERARVLRHRCQGMETWQMQAVISGISLLLQLGVAFFIVGIVFFALPLHPVVSFVVNVLIGIWVALWLGAAICPMFHNQCPFRSPLARILHAMIFSLWQLLRVLLRRPTHPTSHARTLDVQEGREVRLAQDALDRDALFVVFNAHWGDPILVRLYPCIEELPRNEASVLIRQLCTPARCVPASDYGDVLSGHGAARDQGVMGLVNLWKRIEQAGSHGNSTRPVSISNSRASDVAVAELTGKGVAQRPHHSRGTTYVEGGHTV